MFLSDNQFSKYLLCFIPQNAQFAKNSVVSKVHKMFKVLFLIFRFSPVVVDDTCNFDVIAKRLAWGKLVNAGQVGL